MRGHELLDAMEGIDARFLEEADIPPRKRTPIWLRAVSVAACVCFLTGAVFGVVWWRRMPSSPMDNTLIALPQNGKLPSSMFETLDELIAARGEGESHPNRADSFLLEATVQTADEQMMEAQQAIVHDSFVYHVGNEGVMMSDLSQSSPVSTSVAKGKIDCLLYTEQHLIVVESVDTQLEKPLSTAYATKVTVYALDDPRNLLQVHEWTQGGELSKVFLQGDELVLMTTDGQCACGFPRTKTKEDYLPQLTVNAAPVAWDNDGMSVLGNPRVVQYLAVSRVRVSTAEVMDHHAFYGTIEKIWYGGDWLALYCYDDNPLVYTFDLKGTIGCTGTIDAPDKDFAQVSIRSVDKKGDIYRVVGTYRTGRGGNTNVQMLAMTANMKKGELRYEIHGFETPGVWSAETVCWEEDIAIMEASYWSIKEEFNRLMFARFHGMNIRLFVSDAAPETTPVARDIDAGYFLDDPQNLIPLSKGCFLRYNADLTGFDVWDLSSLEHPICLHPSKGEIDDAKLMYVWHVYDKNTVGVQVIYPDENGRYRDAVSSWNIYRVTPRDDTPLTLISSTPLGAVTQSNDSLTAFSYKGQPYVVTRSMTAPVKIQ